LNPKCKSEAETVMRVHACALVASCLMFASVSPAQTATTTAAVEAPKAEQPNVTHFEIETDPFYILLLGASLDVAIARPHWRLQALPFTIQPPQFFHGNDGFTQRLVGVSLDLDTFPVNPAHGLFLGPVVTFTRDRIERTASGNATWVSHLTMGLRLGYRWFPFASSSERSSGEVRGFYLSPFVAPLVNVAQDAVLDGARFHERRFSFFGSMHAGWRF
jgi:hypothetical protein